MPAIEQAGRRVIADEAGGAGDQDSHRTLSLPLSLAKSRDRRATDTLFMSIASGRGAA